MALSIFGETNGAPQQLAQMTGLPVVDSWQGVIFLLIAIWAFLARRKGESLIVMEEQEHQKSLEHVTRVQGSQHEQLTEAYRRVKELQEKLDARSESEVIEANKESEELREKLHNSRTEIMKVMERCLKAEAELATKEAEHKARIEFMDRYYQSVVTHKCMEIDRIRRSREFFRKKCEDAAQDMHLRGMEEESLQLAEEINSPSGVSSPGVAIAESFPRQIKHEET